ncbi:lipopolysaccharide kinase InaA family protein [Isoalcanivorax beigongshangi]|uniref:Lipopolysaccharide kinase InaA family protein n=1 Tax=Isoalcanivorax beigongshangi TaxID=3238810 RepID=A0ABV4AHE5_9GAMM
MANWQLHPAYQALVPEFHSLDQVFALAGTPVTRDPISDVIRIERHGIGFYIKRYWNRNHRRGWRDYLRHPRVQREWENLARFAAWHIPTASVVANGLERRQWGFVRGAMITREIASTESLATLAERADPRFDQPGWVARISRQVADITRTLHRQRFAHNDLKWRNLLVDHNDIVYLIDCPTGTFWRGPFLQHRIAKDLACLDKLGRRHLSSAQRLAFYRHYRGNAPLTARHRRQLAKVRDYFTGRD